MIGWDPYKTKTQRREEQKALKLYLRGRLFWDSQKLGTFVKRVENPYLPESYRKKLTESTKGEQKCQD